MKVFSLQVLLIALSLSSLGQDYRPVSSGVYQWKKVQNYQRGRVEISTIVEGTTYEFSYFRVDAVTIANGGSFKNYDSRNEQLIIVKDGTLDFALEGSKHRFVNQSVLLLPPGNNSTFSNSDEQVTSFYLLTFRSRIQPDTANKDRELKPLLFHSDTMVTADTGSRLRIDYFNRPTAMTTNYEMHITELKLKGASHKPHSHVDTEIILMINGHTEMTIDGKRFQAGPGDFYIIESGKMHGVANAGDTSCRYFAFKWR
jgi:(S)-ureidoglycine aminohydrolase